MKGGGAVMTVEEAKAAYLEAVRVETEAEAKANAATSSQEYLRWINAASDAERMVVKARKDLYDARRRKVE